ncbi:uncharacterized protein LOC133884980 [Phragmites australis]|uniref:uncharacterized protein LOC133884980 n=1 Tax=Phragmites australis TaxID=29695 RepID=UPI002D7782FB|nr:uncharacterized protein LOC133884980 [Phragmites australis]
MTTHLDERECYYLRVLLNHVTGATSYEDLRIVDGEILPSFHDAAERRGLIEVDNMLDECLTEAELFQMPSLLRRLFATILVFCEPSDACGLWNRHLEAMLDDYRRTDQCAHTIKQKVLIYVRNMLQSIGNDITSFPLPEIDETLDMANGVPREIFEESMIIVDHKHTALSDSLNVEQGVTYDEILVEVDSGEGGLFFVNGPGGTGKTFLYKTLLAIVHGFTKQSGMAKLLQAVSLIMWDEASMTKRWAVEALDNSMHDIMGPFDVPFGGKTVVFGGDFRQSDPWFAEYLLRIGNGTEEANGDGKIRLLDDICVSYTGKDVDLDKLIDNVFSVLDANLADPYYITSRAILSTRNEGDEMVYHSFNHVEDDPYNYYPPEFLNSLTPNEFPSHVMKLKVDYPVILLRNIDPANRLCNGTRLMVRGFQRNAIDVEIVLGQHARKRIFLPRIPLCPSNDEMFSFWFKRKQFPIKPSFAMTINKAHGQNIPNVDMYLP